MPTEQAPMWAPKHPPGSNLKGGGLRGGPKRWTGAGPRPARHIPWPEIFKHHISVIEGHLKMIDMVRKHTVEGSGNHKTIMVMVNRTQDMLRMAKEITRTFVPPANDREKVPIGSSSASMYPGYSPADHMYGKAAEELGAEWSAAKAKGIEFKPDPEGPQYEISQAKGIKRNTLAQIRAAKAAREGPSGNGTGSGSDAGPTVTSVASAPNPQPTAGKGLEGKGEEAEEEGNPYFVVDTKPTPVNLPGISNAPTKRASISQLPEKAASNPSKKAKTRHQGGLSGAERKTVEFEDITEEVDARMKEREEKRRRKEERSKRKRESDGVSDPEEGNQLVKPKKKSKKDNGESLINGAESKKRLGTSDGEAGSGDGEVERKKKKKKSKKSKEDVAPV